ncbi:metallophosphoesterase [Microbulbifer hainanensis]|uniref:metallophosphoesterase n=1 Tax=Microbulbifer hainanensis TaxID=2735675 RepID=UPI001868BDE4|nr:metallophosphoesterase [Microbulbifer hainanensis]
MTMLRRVRANGRGRDFVVGDVHGHFAQLTQQLAGCGFDPAVDRLFFLGDVVDRGPDSEAVLAMIDQRTYCSVLGNHEAMMIAGFEEPGQSLLHRMNGGEWFYELPVERQKMWVERVRSWPWAIEVDTGQGIAGLVHANVPDCRWERVVGGLNDIDPAWQAGEPLSAPAIGPVAHQLLWSRTLAEYLYRAIPETSWPGKYTGENNALPEASAPDGVPVWDAALPAQALGLFKASGIDAIYLGHTYVPAVTRAGDCYFLDTYRAEPGEQLGLLCLNVQIRGE